MPQLTPVPFDRMDEELQAMAKSSDEALGGSQWLQYFAHAPDLHKRLSAFYGDFILAERNGISSRTIELVRRKVAEWNECRLWQGVIYASARHQGVDEALCEELKEYESSAAFTAAEKAAIRLADKMASDHTNVGHDVFIALREHYTEQQILELAWRAAMFIGYGRLIVTLGIESVGQSCAISAHRANNATG